MKQNLLYSLKLRACLLVAVVCSAFTGKAWADTYTRISSLSELSDGDEVIFVNQEETYACGTTQNTNNRTPVSITVSDHSYIYSSSDHVQVFVVKVNASGKFGFHTGNGYIYSASNSNNYIKTNTTAASSAPSGTSAWVLSISSNVISATNVTNTSYYLAFNGISYFSQYKSGQSKPYIFKKQATPTANISMTTTDINIAIGATSTRTASSTTTGATISYSSSDASIATVDASTGEVTAVSEGTATITATASADGFLNATASYTVIVSDTRTATTVTIGGSLSYGDYTGEDIAAGTLTATVKKTSDDSTVDGATVTWSSDNEVVATVSAGAVTIKGAGTAHITAYYDGDSNYKSSSAEQTVVVTAEVSSYKYVAVTSVSQLADGMKVIIANSTVDYAMSTNQKTSNREAVALSIVNDEAIIPSNGNIQIFTLEKAAINSKELYYFYTGSGYIYAASSTANQLKTQNSTNNNAKARITISGETTSIVFEDSSNRNVLQYNYNSGSPIFSCYSTASQTAVSLFKQKTQPVTVTDAGYATFCSTEALDFTDVDNIYAFKASVEGSTLTFSRVKKVPANTGVLLYSVSGNEETAEVPVLSTASAIVGNVFVAATDEIASLATTTDGNTNYILNNGSNGVGFYQAAGQKVGAGKAYISIPTVSGVKSFAINLDLEDGIEFIQDGQLSMDNGAIYNLAGQRLRVGELGSGMRVNKAVKGIYIQNGRKFIVK